MGLGDDINAIIRVCPPPRDGESEASRVAMSPRSTHGCRSPSPHATRHCMTLPCLVICYPQLACQVDAAILVAWVGNAAAKLSFAASNCATTIKVNALCGVGHAGYGRVAASFPRCVHRLLESSEA